MPHDAENQAISCTQGRLWKLPRLMEMWKIKMRKVTVKDDFPHSHSRLENSHSTSFHSEFSTVTTASTAALS
jgi:hypothetical protein